MRKYYQFSTEFRGKSNIDPSIHRLNLYFYTKSILSFHDWPKMSSRNVANRRIKKKISSHTSCVVKPINFSTLHAKIKKAFVSTQSNWRAKRILWLTKIINTEFSSLRDFIHLVEYIWINFCVCLKNRLKQTRVSYIFVWSSR